MADAFSRGMALRELRDRHGEEWRVWDNRPESVHPMMRDSRSMRGFSDGWLVFESADGRTRLRLAPIPARWPDVDERELRMWLESAREVRTFRYPGGRFWTVEECARPEGNADRVLRFTTGAHSLDRPTWPRDWRRYSEEQLAELLATSFPRAGGGPASGPRRRASDTPAS